MLQGFTDGFETFSESCGGYVYRARIEMNSRGQDVLPRVVP
jgi:hypothetical protein